ncbi:amino acid adenylation domain-containing protein [Microbulbifer halophilus]|uniref:Non-ribosomal peptide synthetase n=2 Tax=Microbulbifer halophilus TaxID=453963 RepID=A0ABW5EDP9_9GAMM|nr:non-ribosomal peptide synthetase [Microbulbifer halophilus]MCW8128234.1 amino acid adenylation domain-containing protein [Microbulbifer halophilus]
MHELLRTSFPRSAGMPEPLQLVGKAVGRLRFDSCDAPTASLAVDDLECLYKAPVPKTHSPDTGLEVVGLRARDGTGLLLLSADAMLADGPGLLRLAAALCDRAATVPEPLQYIDVAAGYKEIAEGVFAREGSDFWTRRLAELPPSPRLAYARAGSDGWRRDAVEADLDIATASSLSGMGEDAEPLLLAAWALLLRRATRAEGALALSVANDARRDAELADTIGPLTRYLPLVVNTDPRQPIASLVSEVRSQLASVREWEDYLPVDALGQDGAPGYLAYGFALTTVPEGVPEVLRYSAQDEPCQVRLTVLVQGPIWRLSLGFDAEGFPEASMSALLTQYQELLKATLAAPQAVLGELSHLGEAERSRLTGVAEPAPEPVQTVPQMFAEAVRRRGDHPALSGEAGEWTYEALDAASNRLAHRLLAEGVGPESRVAVCLDRTPGWILALLATLKAGGVYVPIDPEFHPERIRFMLADADCAVWLSDTDHAPRLGQADTRLLLLDDLDALLSEYPQTAPGVEVDPRQLAYLIYTSGSTGQPKGVGVPHSAVQAYVEGVLPRLRLAEDAELLSLATIGADLGHTALFGALCSGRCLRLMDADAALDTNRLAALLAARPVDCLKIVPTHLQALLSVDAPERLLPRQCLVVGGEALEAGLVERVRRLAPDCRIVNHYGPTETTVGIATHAVEEKDGAVPPIGRVLPGSRGRVLDAAWDLAGTGIPGELAIGGAALARGYWRRPDLTAERFLPDPLSREAGSRVYRTGDLADSRDGVLHFHGRIDHQVKIRGYRVELGEIEAVLCEHPAVDAACVAAQPGEQLAGYVVGQGELDFEALKDWLRARLPEYMVPSRWREMRQLPLNRNGKVDRQALPEIAADLDRRTAYVAPRNELERQLADLWQAVLGVERVGVEDNFFELGGDSIIAIQIAARVNRTGFALQPKRIFQAQTIAAIAEGLERTRQDDAPAHGRESGRMALLPSQSRFFELHPDGLDHFNQAVYMKSNTALHWPALRAALQAVYSRHHALNSHFVRDTAGNWWQDIDAEPSPPLPLLVDLSALPASRRKMAKEEAAAAAQASLRVEEGLLSRLLVFREDEVEGPARLLWLFHHLVVDGVSWRILLEDINIAYAQVAEGQSPVLGGSSSPLLHWSQAMARHAEAAVAQGEVEWWESAVGPRPADAGQYASGAVATTAVELDSSTTATLLRKLPRAFNTEINHALLTALALAFQRWNGTEQLLVELEGHGREAIDASLDTTATVGWFTARYPIRLPAATAFEPGRLLAAVKDALMAVPERGLGYGALRYCSADDGVRERMRSLAEAEVSFNYMGQFGRGGEGDDLAFDVVPTKVGHLHGAGVRRAQPLAISGTVADACLALEITHDEAYCSRAEADRLGELIREALRELAEFAGRDGQPGCTPSDYPGCELDQDELQRILALHGGRDRVESIYPVSPLQHGMLFETMLHPGTGVNMLQLDLAVTGSLDAAAMRLAWNDVAARHPILRTVFHSLDSEHPRQIVLSDAALDWDEQDLSALDSDEQTRRGDGIMEEDRTAAVDMGKQVMSRVRLLRLGEGHYRMLWTRHHALVDGWSSAIVLRELMESYAQRSMGEVPGLPAARSYGDYVGWMRRRQQTDDAEGYWRNHLSGFSQPTRAGAQTDWHRSLSRDTAVEHQVPVPVSLVDALRDFARREQLTVGCVYQAAWGLVLAAREGRDDIVYGTVVSGRPAELDGVETIVGPLINTLPLRLRPPRGGASAEWLRSIQTQLLEHDANSHLPLPQIQKQSGVADGEPLFASLLVVQNFITDTQRRDIEQDRKRLGVHLEPAPTAYKISYPLTLFVALGGEDSLRLCYDPGQFTREAIAEIASEMIDALARLVDGEVPVAPAPATATGPQSMDFHHIGVACADMDSGIAYVRSQFQIQEISETVYDPLQDATLCLIAIQGGTRIELVSGAQVAGLLARGITLYHTCYEVDDLAAAMEGALASGGTLVAEPKPAVLFDNRRVAFVQTPLGLVEFLERQASVTGAAVSAPTADTVDTSASMRQLVVAGTFTIDPMREALAHFAQWSGLPARVELAPYAQLFQQLVDAESPMRRNEYGANLMVVRLEDWLGDSPTAEPDAATLEGNVAQFCDALTAAAAGSAVPYLLLIAPVSPRVLAYPDLNSVYRHWEQRLIQLAAQLPAVHLVEGRKVIESFNLAEGWFDEDSEQLAHLPYSADAMTGLAVGAVRAWHSVERAPAKVVVVDCDQTLWGGVCAEVGAEGVVLSRARLELQDLLVKLCEAGLLICLCSRNVESDVMAVFEGRSDMRLKREHLTSWRVNWQPKPDNLRDMAAEFGLGLDSFVFIDDDPVQCAQMRSACPSVLTLELPEDEGAIMPLLRQVWALDVRPSSEESRRRGEMYRQNRERTMAASAAPSLADFIDSLQLDIDIDDIGEREVARVAELTLRTNQFNLSGQRRTEAELDSQLRLGELGGFCVRLRDRFGDYGLIGAVLYRRNAEVLETDTFLLSCRALGRGVEHAMIRELGRRAAALHSSSIALPLVASERNAPVRNFLASVFGEFGDGARDTRYLVPATAAADLVWDIEEAPEQTPEPAVSTASSAEDRVQVPYEAIARALTDIGGVTTELQLAALPEGRKLRPYEPPSNPVERKLCALYGELLGIGRVGIKDHFFELGGHSILATRLVAACQREFGVELPLVRIFEVPVVEEFAGVLQALQWARTSAEEAEDALGEAMEEGAV